MSLTADQFSNIGEMVKRRAAEYGDDPAFTLCLPNGISGALSFAEADRVSDDLAAYFGTVLGLGAGERVAVMLPNCLAYPLVAFGALKAGLALTGINPLYTADEIRFQLRDSGANVEPLNRKAWPGPVLALFERKVTPDRVRAAAGAGDAKGSNERTCEAEFYIGEYALLRDNAEAAREALGKARDICPPNASERGAAAAEFARMTK